MSTSIEWTDETWNPIVGCSVISPGCTNCYAMKMAGRLELMGSPIYAGHTTKTKAGFVWNGKVSPSNWGQVTKPLSWKRPRRIFVNSMSDLFHEELPDESIDQVFAVMALCPQHTFQVLTKRAERMYRYLGSPSYGTAVGRVWARAMELTTEHKIAPAVAAHSTDAWPLPNVWLGVSAEDQVRADERIPHLLETPAAVRFISAEPLLGPVDFSRWAELGGYDTDLGLSNPGLDWIIVGGESGPGARPMHPDWARSIRDQCQVAGVPFFFKQWGEWTPGENVARQSGGVETAHWFNERWTLERENLARDDGHIDDQPDLYRVGKKAAGATLDGREWREFPA